MPIITPGRYAVVVSTLALVISLGGTSYAATKISGRDIKNGSVSSKDLASAVTDQLAKPPVHYSFLVPSLFW